MSIKSRAYRAVRKTYPLVLGAIAGLSITALIILNAENHVVMTIYGAAALVAMAVIIACVAYIALMYILAALFRAADALRELVLKEGDKGVD